MKKILFLAALAAVFSASAEDMWLRWMIDESSTIDKGEIPETVYAKVKDVDNDTYLSIYTNPDRGSYYGDYKAVDMSDSMPMFAGILSSTDVGSTFVIELYRDSNFTEGSWIGKSLNFTVNSANLTSAGMTTASPAHASAFTSVPEPTSGMLLLLGVAGLALRRKNKKA